MDSSDVCFNLISHLYSHLSTFGSVAHVVGSGDVLSKTEATFFPRTRAEYSDADKTRLDVFVVTSGSVGFTKEWKYLGSTVNYSLSSEADVDKRIKSAYEDSNKCYRLMH